MSVLYKICARKRRCWREASFRPVAAQEKTVPWTHRRNAARFIHGDGECAGRSPRTEGFVGTAAGSDRASVCESASRLAEE
jgi:hypothetical protein